MTLKRENIQTRNRKVGKKHTLIEPYPSMTSLGDWSTNDYPFKH